MTASNLDDYPESVFKLYLTTVAWAIVFILWSLACIWGGAKLTSDSELDKGMIIESRTRHLNECLDLSHICMSALDECGKRLPK